MAAGLAGDLAALEHDAVGALEDATAGLRDRPTHPGVARLGHGRGVPVPGHLLDPMLGDQPAQHLGRIAVAHDQLRAGLLDVGGQALEAVEQEAHAWRGASGQLSVEDEEQEQPIGRGRVSQRGVVRQAEIVAEPVDRAHDGA